MKVWEFLNTPEKWTKGSYARIKNGDMCNIDNSQAVCFCVSGAIAKCYGDSVRIENGVYYTEAVKTVRKLEDFLMKKYKVPSGYRNYPDYPDYIFSVAIWNDKVDLTYEEMIGALKECDV